MADHDYKQGGWKNKYIVFKRCDSCEGTGTGNCGCHSLADCNHFFGPVCKTCQGKGYVPVDAQAVYFVLRLDEDPHARYAALSYADSIATENLEFASDIRAKVTESEAGK